MNTKLLIKTKNNHKSQLHAKKHKYEKESLLLGKLYLFV